MIREKALVKKDSSSYNLPKASLIKSRAIIGPGKIERSTQGNCRFSENGGSHGTIQTAPTIELATKGGRAEVRILKVVILIFLFMAQ